MSNYEHRTLTFRRSPWHRRLRAALRRWANLYQGRRTRRWLLRNNARISLWDGNRLIVSEAAETVVDRNGNVTFTGLPAGTITHVSIVGEDGAPIILHL